MTKSDGRPSDLKASPPRWSFRNRGFSAGTASVVNLGDAGVRDRVLRPDLVQTVGFQRTFQLGGSYPNSSMGTLALMKQTLMDADWYIRAWDAYESSGRGSFLATGDQ